MSDTLQAKRNPGRPIGPKGPNPEETVGAGTDVPSADVGNREGWTFDRAAKDGKFVMM